MAYSQAQNVFTIKKIKSAITLESLSSLLSSAVMCLSSSIAIIVFRTPDRSNKTNRYESLTFYRYFMNGWRDALMSFDLKPRVSVENLESSRARYNGLVDAKP
jgi:hypothetical protein